jgi:glycosyltransferase involved in cell wall biosynthesis
VTGITNIVAAAKILQVLPALDTGGVEQTTLDMARAMVEHGYEALVACEGGRYANLLKDYGARLITLPLASKNTLTLWHNSRALKKLIEEEKIDLVHARSRAPAWSAYLSARQTGTPFVTTYHGIYNQTNAFKAFYNSVMAKGDRVIANSHYTARIIQERHKITPDRLRVIHRGTDLRRFNLKTLSERRRIEMRERLRLNYNAVPIVNVARLTPWKGQDIALRAFQKLAQEHYELVLILAGDEQGRSGYKYHLQEMARHLKIDDRVVFAGHVDDIPALMSLAHCVIVTSIEPEAFGRAAVEAQAMEKPVIVSRAGAVEETVASPPLVSDKDRTGWIVPAGEVSPLVTILKEVLALDSEQRARLALRGRAHVEEHFSLKAMTDKTLAVYDELLRF